jgi:cytochrome c biogenesis protein CcmG, thiol:disulfide interchange protein DsbE
VKANRVVLVAGLVVTLPLVGLLFSSLGRDPHRIDSPLVGRAAPPFHLVPLGGGAPLTLDSLRGRPIVLNFWATWCVPCVEEHPALLRAARRYGPEATFVGVVYADDEQAALAYLREHGSAYPAVVDNGGKAAIAFGVYGVPETFFISPDGVITQKHVGPLDDESITRLVAQARGAAPAASGAGGATR